MNLDVSRGRVLIINNHYFLDSNLVARKGAQFDRKNLKQLFEQLSFTVEIHDNQSMKVGLMSLTSIEPELQCIVIRDL